MYMFIKEQTNEKISKFKKIFNIVEKKEIDELHHLYIIPKVNNSKKILKILKNNEKNKIILSNNLREYNKELNICKNKITKYFIYHILKYIELNTQLKIETQNLYILADDYNEENIQIIKFLKDKVKTITIVTNNIKKYKMIEENNCDLITITNNKSKALKRANTIINLDVENETLNKYKFPQKCIIINCIKDKINMLKFFEGIIINNINIKLSNLEKIEELIDDFELNELYESFYITNTKYIENIKNIENNKAKIVNLIGNNGIISTKELANIYKNIDKSQKKD